VDKILKVVLLIALSILGLYLAFYNIDFNNLVDQLSAVNLTKFFAAIIILMISCIIRAKRLQYILVPLDDGISLHHLFSSTMIGYFGNGILLFRLGEVLKAYSISVGNKVSTSESFGIIMLERIMDALTVLIMLILFLPWLPIENVTINYWVSAFAGVTVLFFIMILVLRSLDWAKLINSISFLSESMRKGLISIVEKIFAGVNAIKNTKHAWGILFTTLMIWVCYYVMTLWLLESCQIYLTSSGAIIMLIMGAIIIAVPALPGGLGTYDAGITFSLMLIFSVSKDEALTYALISHASNYIPYLVVGSVYFVSSGIKISDIKKRLS
tara:strand:+ start:28377 stop:29354 length:978 start_codon:yes stop_codon:yes gene_type:complete